MVASLSCDSASSVMACCGPETLRQMVVEELSDNALDLTAAFSTMRICVADMFEVVAKMLCGLGNVAGGRCFRGHKRRNNYKLARDLSRLSPIDL